MEAMTRYVTAVRSNSESAPQGCVIDRPGVYKLPMVRMHQYVDPDGADEAANVRVLKSASQKCDVAFIRCQCGRVRVTSMKIRVALQAHQSWKA